MRILYGLSPTPGWEGEGLTLLPPLPSLGPTPRALLNREAGTGQEEKRHTHRKVTAEDFTSCHKQVPGAGRTAREE